MSAGAAYPSDVGRPKKRQILRKRLRGDIRKFQIIYKPLDLREHRESISIIITTVDRPDFDWLRSIVVPSFKMLICLALFACQVHASSPPIRKLSARVNVVPVPVLRGPRGLLFLNVRDLI